MFVLHVGIKLKPAREQAAKSTFSGPFRAAISAQQGFREVRLLEPRDGGEYVLSIAFESQALQQQWVASALHAQVWSQMEANFEGYTISTFTAI